MSQKPSVAQSPQTVPWALTSDRLEEFCRQLGLRPVPISGHYFSDLAQEIGMVELMVPPDSPLVDKTVTGHVFALSTTLSSSV